jgi:hypothetical protein
MQCAGLTENPFQALIRGSLAGQPGNKDGQVAQLVEQRIENPRVDGSIPPLATKIQRPTVLSWAFSFVLPA